MSKRIIVCCDGTWNEPENLHGERIVPTNVLKLVRAVAAFDAPAEREQVIFYDAGIGTLGFAEKWIGGGTGWGISNNIKDCYRFLANNFAEGDEIYCFGASRGAYTVRSLVGLLDAVGLLNAGDLEFLPQAYAYYRTPPGQRLESEFHPLIAGLHRRHPHIHFLGVWDTVAALGVPTPVLGPISRRFWVGFHNADLSDRVRNAYQAVSIDERRGPYRPCLWEHVPEGATVEQVWFPGSHRNVLGGCVDAGISDVCLDWMVRRARNCGLAFNEDYLAAKVDPDVEAPLVDSFSSGYRLLERFGFKAHMRPIGARRCNGSGAAPCVGEMVHEGVLQRMSNPLLRYRPANLIGDLEDLEILLSEMDGHQTLQVHGVPLPVFKERRFERNPLHDVSGRLLLDDHTEQSCEVLDFAEFGGARIRGGQGLSVGSSARLESDPTGARRVTVVWRNATQMGLKFAA